MKTLILSLFVFTVGGTSAFAKTVGPHVYELCISKKFPHLNKSVKDGLKMAKQMNGKTLVLFEESPSKYHKGLFPMKINAKKLSDECVEFTVVTADPEYQPGTGGDDLDIDMGSNWLDFSIGDDGRSHYLIMHQGDLGGSDEMSECDKNSKGKYVNGYHIGTAVHEWSGRVDSLPFNGCFE